MRELILVGCGSMLGGMGRFYLHNLVGQTFPDNRLPLGTLAVNLLGCATIGLLGGIIEIGTMNQNLRLLLVTGLLGGFTTFSAFSFETLSLIRTKNLDMAILNVLLSVVLCLLAAWVGVKIGLLLGDFKV